MGDLIKFSVPDKPEYVGLIRLAVSAAANIAGFDVEAIEDIKVAVSEACTNALCHGKEKTKNYNIECHVETDKMSIFVQDNGCGYNISSYQEPDKDNPKEGGFGLFIIRALMDEVNVHSKEGMGTTIEMIKYVV